MAIKMVHVVCAECRAEVDRIEYDENGLSRAVQNLMNDLGYDLAKAIKTVKRDAPGAEFSSEENARSLAESIANQTVEGRPAESYACPNGHDSYLLVTDDNPTPAVSTAVTKTEVL